jgi:hypothetical protein
MRNARPNDWQNIPFYSFCRTDFSNVGKAMLHTPANAGKNILVVWDHGNIPYVMNQLNSNILQPGYWAKDVYSITLEVTYPAGASATNPHVESRCDCLSGSCDAAAQGFKEPSPNGVCLLKGGRL